MMEDIEMKDELIEDCVKLLNDKYNSRLYYVDDDVRKELIEILNRYHGIPTPTAEFLNDAFTHFRLHGMKCADLIECIADHKYDMHHYFDVGMDSISNSCKGEFAQILCNMLSMEGIIKLGHNIVDSHADEYDIIGWYGAVKFEKK